MKLLKWGVVFLSSFFISFILIQTFSQDAFKELAPGRIIKFTTPSIPIYWYIIGSFLTGLCVGLIVAFYNFITSTSTSFRKSRRIKELEKDVDYLSDQNKEPSDDEHKESEDDTAEEEEPVYEPDEDVDKTPDKETEKKKDPDEDLDSFIG